MQIIPLSSFFNIKRVNHKPNNNKEQVEIATNFNGENGSKISDDYKNQVIDKKAFE